MDNIRCLDFLSFGQRLKCRHILLRQNNSTKTQTTALIILSVIIMLLMAMPCMLVVMSMRALAGMRRELC
jgi:hypothetical protein